MANTVMLKNIGNQTEHVYVQGERRRVVPTGTVLVPPTHPAVNWRAFEVIGDVPTKSGDSGKSDKALRDRIKELEAQLAAVKTADANPEASKDEDPVKTEFPVHVKGGSWHLSDGTLTRGGLSRVEAEALEAALHQE